MPEHYNEKFKRWIPNDLPIIPEETKLIPGKETKKQFKIVKDLMNSSNITEIVNATDSGREGELIFDNVYRLSGSEKPVLRLWTSSLTEDAIRNAYDNLRPSSEYYGLRDAARSRAEADWLIGINATRLETLAARSSGKNNGVFPVGRVQTPTLTMIVNREKEIINFKPQDFWTVEACFDQDESSSYKGIWFNEDKSRFDDEAKATAICEKVTGKSGEITKLEKKQEVKKAPLLYDLTTLQREANQRFGFTADNTLTICQSLYENHKVLSYPRTNSRYLTESEASELSSIVSKFEDHDDYSDLFQHISFDDLPKRFVNAKKVEDHHAIIPTGLISNDLSDKESKIFDMVLRRSLAAFCEDRIDQVTKVETVVDNESFRSTGRIMETGGWWLVNPGSEKDNSSLLPNLDKSSPVSVVEINHKKGKTKAPPRYTESTLLSKMENAGKDLEEDDLKDALKDAGLGTPATRASIIEGLKSRGLLTVKGKNLSPTPKGMDLISQIPNGPLKSPELTGEWEKKLSMMAKGQYERANFMAEIESLARSLVDARKDGIDLQPPSQKEVGECPRCSSTLHLRQFESRRYVKCSNNDCKLAYGADDSGSPIDGNCRTENCQGPVTKTKKGSLICVLCGTWQDTIPTKDSIKCPSCEESHLLRRKGKSGYFWGCSSYPSCKATYPDKRGKPNLEPKKVEVSEFLCNVCNKGLIRRKAKKKNTYFWGCSGFPDCKEMYFESNRKPVLTK